MKTTNKIHQQQKEKLIQHAAEQWFRILLAQIKKTQQTEEHTLPVVFERKSKDGIYTESHSLSA